MVTAIVYFDTSDPLRFPQVLAANAASVVAAPGYRGHSLKRGVEQPNRYLLSIEWDSVDDHVVWQTEHGAAFLAALGAIITGQPDIKHFH